jgi:hypothetical protein
VKNKLYIYLTLYNSTKLHNQTMTDHNAITPPPELIEQWISTVRNTTGYDETGLCWLVEVATTWAADQELDACCEYLMYEQDRQGLRKFPPSENRRA